jgi:hypothetical protein
MLYNIKNTYPYIGLGDLFCPNMKQYLQIHKNISIYK